MRRAGMALLVIALLGGLATAAAAAPAAPTIDAVRVAKATDGHLVGRVTVSVAMRLPSSTPAVARGTTSVRLYEPRTGRVLHAERFPHSYGRRSGRVRFNYLLGPAASRRVRPGARLRVSVRHAMAPATRGAHARASAPPVVEASATQVVAEGDNGGYVTGHPYCALVNRVPDCAAASLELSSVEPLAGHAFHRGRCAAARGVTDRDTMDTDIVDPTIAVADNESAASALDVWPLDAIRDVHFVPDAASLLGDAPPCADADMTIGAWRASAPGPSAVPAVGAQVVETAAGSTTTTTLSLVPFAV